MTSALLKAMALWSDCLCECPHSATEAVRDLCGSRPRGRVYTPQPRRKATGKGYVLHPRLLKHAAALGVNASHLYRVLTGDRRSQRLTDRYNDLVGATNQKGA